MLFVVHWYDLGVSECRCFLPPNIKWVHSVSSAVFSIVSSVFVYMSVMDQKQTFNSIEVIYMILMSASFALPHIAPCNYSTTKKQHQAFFWHIVCLLLVSFCFCFTSNKWINAFEDFTSVFSIKVYVLFGFHLTFCSKYFFLCLV